MKSARGKPLASGRKRPRAPLPKPPQSKLPSRGTHPARSVPGTTGSHWTFLTNHTHVLILISRNPSIVLREVAQDVGITERAVQRIIADLEVGGAIHREKVGRQNRYRIRTNLSLRHSVACHRTIGQLLGLLNSD
jgi:Winged helix-turn-helix DNA-binding